MLPSDDTDYADGATVTAATMTTTTVNANGGTWTFTANEETVSYTVDYDANGGSGSYADENLTSGSGYKVLMLSDTGITRAGYTFKGWNTKADGSGTSYASGDTITITGDMTLYAQWAKTSSGGKTGSGTSGTSGTTISPKTGDTSDIGLWITLLCISLVGVVYLPWTVRRRKQSRQEH